MSGFPTAEISITPGRSGKTPPVAKQAGFSLIPFWAFAGLVLMAWAAGLPLGGSFATAAAAGLILIGGMPHGGHDLHMARRAYRLGPGMMALLLAAYLGIALAMLILWAVAPVAALAAFLLLSAIHFADDWRDTTAPIDVGRNAGDPQTSDRPLDGLLRFAAGLAVICAAAIGQRDAVSALFVGMAGVDAIWIARIAVAAGPVVLLVAAVAISQIWTSGARQRAAAMAAALLLLFITPPLIGFALFFALLHAPRHMQDMQPLLPPAKATSTLITGWSMAALAVGLWMWIAPTLISGTQAFGQGGLFQLLSVVAMPHLACSYQLNRYLGSSQEKGPERSLLPAPNSLQQKAAIKRLQPPPDRPSGRGPSSW